jgi:hypothetical protein
MATPTLEREAAGERARTAGSGEDTVAGAASGPATVRTPTDDIPSCLHQLLSGLAGVVDTGAWSLSDQQPRCSLREAWRVRAGLDELITRLVTAVDQRALAVDDGASSTQAWLVWRLAASRSCAAALLAQARMLSPRVEATRLAWAAGDVSTEQATIIATTVESLPTDLDDEACCRAEAILLERAPHLTQPELRIFANRVIEVVDPEGADARLGAALEAEEARALVQAQLRRRRREDGSSDLSGRLPDLHADMLYTLLDTLASPRRAGTREPGIATGAGISPVVDIDGDHSDSEIGVLTAAQRYGRAFCELIEHLPTDGTGHPAAANATIVVTIDAATLATGVGCAMRDTGSPISAAQTRRLACTAGILPMILDGRSRILDHGMTRRLFDRHQRLALTVRDKGCVWRGCDRPPAWCEAHHITAWSRGGPTDLANGCLLCSFHHHLLHRGEWAIRMSKDHVPDVIPPRRIDPEQRPLRHQRFVSMRN